MSELRESMWDLVYGLLSDEERQALVARIKSEPDAARLYAEVRLEADLVAQAARVEDSSVTLKADPDAVGNQVAKKVALARGMIPRSRADFHRGAAWLAGFATMALAGLLAVGLSWQRTTTSPLASALVAADVFASQPLLAGLTCPVEVRTYEITQTGERAEGAAANVELRIVDRAGTSRFNKTVQTNEIGHATCDLPGEALEPGVRLEVAASKQLPNAAAAASNRVVDHRVDASADHGPALSVELPVQPEPQIAYFLCASPVQQPDQQVPTAEWYFNAFTAKPAQPEVAQNAVAAAAGGYVSEPRAATPAVGNAANGAVQSQNLARANTQLRASVDKVAAGEAATDLKNQAVVPPNQPIKVAIPEQLEGKPLKMTAMNRGVNVATQMVPSMSARDRRARATAAASNKAEPAAEQLSLAVPPEADGLVEVQLFDQSKSQDEPVQRQYVVRQPTRRLQIDVPDAKARYSPGEQVALTVRCTDENGKPAADTRLGVRVWNESAIRESGEEPVLLADAVDHGRGEVVQNTVAPAQQAAAPASQVGQMGRDMAGQLTVREPIELATNREAVKSALVTAATSAETARQRTIMALGGAAVIGGVAVLLLLTMLALLRLSIGWRAMTPGFVVAVASLLLGLGWIGWFPERRMADGVAMSPAGPTTPAGSAVAGSPGAAVEKQLDAAKPGPSVRERDETSQAPAEAASALASSPAPASAGASRPTAPLAESSTSAKQEAAGGEMRSAVVAISPVTPRFEQAGGPIVTMQVRGGQQARAFNLAKDSETESVNRRVVGVAGGGAGFSGGRPAAGPPAGAVTDQLKQKSDGNEMKKEQLAELAAAKPQSAAAPAALYFNPQLMTDSGGKATIQFTMPQADAEYRVLIDALGQGRIGSQQQTIVCGGTPSK